MFMCHAHAFARNATHGGACGEVTPYRKEQEHLTSTIGLTTISPFACPTQESLTSNVSIIADWTEHLLTKEDAAIWTPEWLVKMDRLVFLLSCYEIATTDNEDSQAVDFQIMSFKLARFLQE
jgi:hypothetical protein